MLVDKPDATGTYYRRNRSYDPNTARFTQEDPLGLAGGLNVYGFNGGDPVNFSDPFGLTACCLDLVAVGGAAGGVSSAGTMGAAVGAAAEAAPAVVLAVMVGVALRPAFPGSGKTQLGRGQGTWASEATGVAVLSNEVVDNKSEGEAKGAPKPDRKSVV